MKPDYALDALVTAGLGNAPGGQEDAVRLLSGMTDEDWEEIWQYSRMHQIWGTVFAGMTAYKDAGIPEAVFSRFAEIKKELAYQYYYMLSFTTFVLDLLSKGGIHCYVLKGITLNALYPDEDGRKLADADIYIPDMEEFGRADAVLRAEGFVPQQDFTDIHNGYAKDMAGRTCILELHWKPSERLADPKAEQAVCEIFDRLSFTPDWYAVSGAQAPALPPTEYAFQLLLHMFTHFVHAGFGLRMLCDWCVFWKRKGGETDNSRFLSYLEQTSLSGFAWAVTQGCIRHLGLDAGDVPWMGSLDGALYEGSAELFWNDMLTGGEFGREENSRMVILQKRSFLAACAGEVHSMMRIRFPRLQKCLIAWPFLWTATILIFLRNNRRLNRAGTLEIIGSARNRKTLLKKMKIFELQ